ncbi:transposase [Streptomyces sp. NPDC056738]|uniref:transposase n=1 Tax=Streptomyces sp. NPDC056738 TaxID=3345933 RepID=UPI0036C28697
MSIRLVITDAMWDRIEPLMPADPVCGRRWADHRRTLEGIAWKYRMLALAGPAGELGSFQTAHKRLIRWAADGVWARILAAVLATADADDDVEWTVSVDSTTCRAHQHAAGAVKKGLREGQNPSTTHSDVLVAA